jgi:hypothetical protein
LLKNFLLLKIGLLFDRFIELFAKEEEALNLITKSALTDELFEADHMRDDIYRGMVDTVKGAGNHFDPAIKSASTRLMIVFDYYGNITNKTYDEQTASTKKLIKELTENHADDVNTAGIGSWLAETETRNNAFDQLMTNRYTEESTQTQFRMKQIRREIDAAYRNIIKQVELLMIVDKENKAQYENYLQELNQRIDRFNNTVAQRIGRNAKTEAKAPTN